MRINILHTLLNMAPNGRISLSEFLGILDSAVTNNCGRGPDRYRLYGEMIDEQGFTVEQVVKGLTLPTDKILTAMGAKLITEYSVEKSHD